MMMFTLFNEYFIALLIREKFKTFFLKYLTGRLTFKIDRYAEVTRLLKFGKLGCSQACRTGLIKGPLQVAHQQL